MRSDNIKNTEEKAEITEVSAVDSDVKKQRFGLKIFPETLEMVDTLFEHDNCKSRSEFIEKADFEKALKDGDEVEFLYFMGGGR